MAKKQQKSKNKKTSVNVAANIANRIPYLRCYKEDGIIEIEDNKYSVTYKIEAPENNNERYVNTVVYHCMEQLFTVLKGFTYRFTIRNSVMPVDEYLDKISLPENKEPEINSIIHDYNEVLRENVGIGHNNFKMSLYLTIVTEAEVPDDAKMKFDEVTDQIVTIFNDMYGYKATLLSLEERLEVLYNIYHSDIDAQPFGAKVNYDGNGFSIESMQKMKMNTKDVIAPFLYNTNERDYMRIGNKFVRMLFINSIPAKVTDSLLSDLISISSNSILSTTYQYLDANFGFKATAKKVKNNTEVKNIPIRDTIEDRKNHRIERKETMIVEDEDAYFNQAALSLFADSTAKEEPVILTSFIVGLFSDSLDELDRDTSLLKISASKYNCQIKPCDLQQHEAFVSVLPLGSIKIDVTRTLNIDRLSKLLPVNVQSLFEHQVLLQGLNEINDNFVLIDRTNYPLGMIAGMKTSGKTFALKREIVNTLMSTDDYVVVVAPKPKNNEESEYTKLFNAVNGDIYEPILTDLFTIDENYGLTPSANKNFKAMFLESFITLRIGFHKMKFTTQELEQIYSEIAKETEELSVYSDYALAVSYAKENSNRFRWFLKALNDYIPTSNYPNFLEGSRLNMLYYNKNSELLMQLDYLWNFAIAMKKINKTVWIYVDGIDPLIYSPVTSDYLISLLDKCNKIKVPFTMVVQDAAKICANDVASIEFDYLLEKINYFKLLTLGVIERRKFLEKLNIPLSLATYVTDREPSEGIIITDSVNVSFNDRFETKHNPFYSRL